MGEAGQVGAKLLELVAQRHGVGSGTEVMPKLSAVRLPRKTFSAEELRNVVGGPHGFWADASRSGRDSARMWPGLECPRLDHSVSDAGRVTDRAIAVGEAGS